MRMTALIPLFRLNLVQLFLVEDGCGDPWETLDTL
jgi:hypothetical protein